MSAFSRVKREIEDIVGPEHVKTAPEVIAEYAVDRVTPSAVIYPAEPEQVARVVGCAARENLAIIPRGSGSKMAQGLPPRRLDLVLCTTRLNKVLDIDAANLTLTVQAGVKFKDIQAMLASEEDRCYLPIEAGYAQAGELICSDREHSGCFLPMDPPFAENATIGGILASNATGPRRLLYGLPRDMTLGVRFVTPYGEVVGAGGVTVKNVSGYDIPKLMIGSGGTLGILCEMTFRLLPLPERMETLLFSHESLGGAAVLINSIFERRLVPAAVEVMAGGALLVPDGREMYGFKDGRYIVAVALEGFREAVARMVKEIGEISVNAGAEGLACLQEEEHRRFWLAVSNMLPSLAGRYPELISLKLNFPISKWERVMAFTEETAVTNGLQLALLIHAGSGISIINLLMGPEDAALTGKAIQTVRELCNQSRRIGGNLVVQRAPADLKGELPVWGEETPDFHIMKWIKQEVDPKGIMSPGRFLGGL